MQNSRRPIVIRGTLGWGNRKSGLEAYGPGGRWDNIEPGGGVRPRSNPDGDLLGDALERAGAVEGADLVVIAVNRGGEKFVVSAVLRLLARYGIKPAEQRTPPPEGWNV